MSTLIVSDVLSHLMRALGWTLIHSLWQAGIAALLALVVLWMTGKSKPATRYNVLLTLFIVLMGVILVTFFKEYQQPVVQSLVPAGDLQSNTHPTGYDGIYLLSNETQSYFSAIEQWINAHIYLIVACWLLACGVQTLRVLCGAGHIRRLKTSGALLPDEWNERIEILRNKLRISYPVVTLESARVRVPVVAGLLKPFVLLPLGMLSNIPFDQVESILLHELAHIRRKDHVANALQIAAETILFFNPALLWLSSVIREEREACCDAIAVNELQSSAIYVEALVTFQTYSGSRVHGSLAFAGNKNYLLKRVKRILYNENKKINVMEKIILFAGFAAVCMSPVFFNAKAKPVIHAPMAIVEQVADTLPPSKAESNEEMNPAARRAAKRAEKAAKQAEKAAQQAEKAAEAEEAHQAEVDARVDIQIDTNVNFQIDTNINFNVDQKLSPEVRIQIEKAMKLAEKNVVNSKIALRQVNHQLQQVKLQQTLNSLQMKQQIQQQMQLVNKQMQQLNLKKSLLAEDNELNGIMAFLINKKIITTKENLSFRLDQDALTVNGIKQSESLHSELKEKYISDPGDFYEYKNSGGSTSIGIRRNK